MDFGAVDIKNHLPYRLNADGERIELTPNYVMLYEWFTAWYNSAISFALVEVNARTTNQVIMMFCIYVTNAMINAYLIGVFIDQFSVKNEKKTQKQEKLDESNLTMGQLGCLPESLKQKVRTFFLQSFQMQQLQIEFDELSGSLKKSLMQRLKFELCERIICSSTCFFYIRLNLISNYQKQLMRASPEDKALLNGDEPAVEYKKFVFSLINNLQLIKHEPGQ